MKTASVIAKCAVLLACAAATAACVLAQAPEHRAPAVFASGAWSVVRSAKEGKEGKEANEAAAQECTGLYRSNPHVQLTRDMLIIRTPQDTRSVAHAVDAEPLSPHRPPTDTEKNLGAIAFAGEDLARLSRSHRLRVEALTTTGNLVRHEIDLQGLPAAIENIRAGCPRSGEPVRGRPRS